MIRPAATFLLAAGLTAAAPAAAPAQTPERPAALAALSRDFERVVRLVQPAVVQVAVTALDVEPGERGVVLGEERRTGSGVLLTADGYIVTNAHVVEGARRQHVVLARPAAPEAPGRSIVRPEGLRLPAHVVGVDHETDLAVLKIDGEGFPHLAFADSDSLLPGNFVLAFGSPLGLTQSVSLGVVSAVGRQLEPDAPVVYIQTDASINPGNSGGPLVTVDGRIVGINAMIFSRSGGNEGIGFAVPSNIVRAVVDQIRAAGRVRRGVIGVNAQTITPPLADGLRLPQDWGVVLADVRPRSPAALAGLRPGDIVVSLDRKVMENARQLDVNLYQVPPGAAVSLEIRRGPERLTVPVRVVERDDDPARFADLVSRERHLVPALGVLALPVDGEVGRMLPWIRRPGGLLVAAWDAGSPPVNTGLVPGDVLYSLNGTPLATLADLRAALDALAPGAPVVLHVDRLGQMRYVAFRLE